MIMTRALRQQGQALVESALVFPVMLFFVLGILQLTLMQQARMMTEYAAFNAARAGAVWNMDTDRMLKAAVITLLPTMPTTPATGALHIPLSVDTLPKLGVRYVDFYLENKAAGKLGRKAIDVEVLNPTQADFGKEDEIEFDDIGKGSFAERRPSQLTIRLSYMYELRLPVINWLIFESWLASRAAVDLRGWNPMDPKIQGVQLGLKARLAMEAAMTKDTCKWSGVNQGMVQQLAGVGVATGHYYIPIVTTYTIRMQSNPFKKFASPKPKC
jgi:hypothetical protein